eukprot:gb/GECH01012223.1/.p1 GENE.gb/GECH01012223.1/~~gb/GECH01012223.1/.p1  ORF type:complete len:436 (+),score=87.35 gb/GECH01012223.1/:1-1308(+)
MRFAPQNSSLMALLPFVIILILSLTSTLFAVAQSHCPGNPNTQSIYTKPPTFVKKNEHGKLYRVGGDEPQIYLLHTYGSAYRMGYAHGSILKPQVHALYKQVFEWIYGEIDNYIKFLPKIFRKAIEKYGVEGALDLTYVLTEKYIPKHFDEELKGLADGSGISKSRIIQLHMFPELIKAQCSMYGAWGPAISQTNGTLYQLRALDWSTNGPFQQFPLVQIYHPDNGHPFANVAWTGFVGTMTGFSSAPVGVCEKVWISYDGKNSRSGYPWHFLLRDILQFDMDVDSALSRIASAKRTCSIFVGLGDSKMNQFRAVEYSHENVTVLDDKNFPAYPPDHPQMNGLVFIDKHVQPSHHRCLGSLMQKYYGQLNSHNALHNIAPVHQTGDMHLAFYDYREMAMYVANASPYDKTKDHAVPAYDRQPVRLDMKQLFSEKL